VNVHSALYAEVLWIKLTARAGPPCAENSNSLRCVHDVCLLILLGCNREAIRLGLGFVHEQRVIKIVGQDLESLC